MHTDLEKRMRHAIGKMKNTGGFAKALEHAFKYYEDKGGNALILEVLLEAQGKELASLAEEFTQLSVLFHEQAKIDMVKAPDKKPLTEIEATIKDHFKQAEQSARVGHLFVCIHDTRSNPQIRSEQVILGDINSRLRALDNNTNTDILAVLDPSKTWENQWPHKTRTIKSVADLIGNPVSIVSDIQQEAIQSTGPFMGVIEGGP